MKANPDKFQVMFLCPRRYIDIFLEFFSFLDTEIKREHYQNC